MPNTSKNSFQKVCFSAASLRVPAQLCANWMARWRISFHESGMGEFYSHGGRLSAGIYSHLQAHSKPLLKLLPKQSSSSEE
jgi:hypothetical protein